MPHSDCSHNALGSMDHAVHHLFLSRTIASELIRDHPIRRSALMFQHLPEETLRRFFIFAFLHQNIDYLAILIDCAPEVEPLVVNGDNHHFVQVPVIAHLT